MQTQHAGIQWKIFQQAIRSEMKNAIKDLQVFGQESGLDVNLTKTEEIHINNTNNVPVHG